MSAEPAAIPEYADRLADELDEALASFWSGDSAAFERLAQSHDGDGSNEPDSGGVGSALHRAATWVQRSHADLAPPDAPGFVIEREIGRGGMGVVYEARQNHPARRVAIKVMAPGCGADPYHRSLFQREIRALAAFEHPNIAALHQAGETGDGRAFIVMELVHGEPITAFCRQRDLPLHQRLDLFVQVCDAVHHAHLRGVIHRDLKPSNILVKFESPDGPQSDRPIVKILDFGLARLIGVEGDHTLTLDSAHIKGTMAYMSPEQMGGESGGVDARGDVYALGVMLYEMLGGRLPHDPAGMSLRMMMREIESRDPPRLGALRRDLRGDLEVIAATALAKEPSRRYQSAAQLADDCRRFLRHEPIAARPASATYLLHTFARRHRALVGAAAVALVALSLGLIGTTAALMRLNSAQQETRDARAMAERVNEFLNSMLAPPDAQAMRVRGFSVQTMLEDAVARLDAGALVDQPAAEAEARITIANAFETLGSYASSVAQRERVVELQRSARGEASVETVRAYLALANTLGSNGEIARRLDTANLAVATCNMLPQPDERLAIDVLLCQGFAMRGDEARRQVDTLVPRAIRLDGEDSILLADIRTTQAFLHLDHAVAIELNQQALAIYRRNLDPDDPRIPRTLVNLGFLLYLTHHDAEGLAALQEALSIRERLYGPDHPAVASVLFNLANFHSSRNRREQAVELYRRALHIQQATLVEDHFDIARTHYRFGRNLMAMNRLDEANAHFRMAREAYRRKPPFDLNYTKDALRYGAECLIRMERFEEAEPLLLEALAVANSMSPPAPQTVRDCVASLVSLYVRWGKVELVKDAAISETSRP